MEKQGRAQTATTHYNSLLPCLVGEAALFACQDRDVLRAFLQEQLSAWDAVGLQAKGNHGEPLAVDVYNYYCTLHASDIS